MVLTQQYTWSHGNAEELLIYLLVSATANIQNQTVGFKNGGIGKTRSKLKNVKECHKYCQYNIVN